MPYLAEVGLLQEEGFEGRGLGGELFGKLGEKGGTVKGMTGTITGIAVEQGRGEGVIRRETLVNKRGEHLLIAQIRLDLLVSRRARISGTA